MAHKHIDNLHPLSLQTNEIEDAVDVGIIYVVPLALEAILL